MAAKIMITLLPLCTVPLAMASIVLCRLLSIVRGMLSSSTVAMYTSATNNTIAFIESTELSDSSVTSQILEQSNSVIATISPTSTQPNLMSTSSLNKITESTSLNTSFDSSSNNLMSATLLSSSNTVNLDSSFEVSSSTMSTVETIINGTILTSDKSILRSNIVSIPKTSITLRPTVDLETNSSSIDDVTMPQSIQATTISENIPHSSFNTEITPTLQISDQMHSEQSQSPDMSVFKSDSSVIISSIPSIYKETSTLTSTMSDSVQNYSSSASIDLSKLEQGSSFSTSLTVSKQIGKPVRESKISTDMFSKSSISQTALPTATESVRIIDIQPSISISDIDIFQSTYFTQGVKSDTSSSYLMKQQSSLVNYTTEYVDKVSPTTHYINKEHNTTSNSDTFSTTFSYEYQYIRPSVSSSTQQTESAVTNQTIRYIVTPTTTTTSTPDVQKRKLYSFSYEIEFTGECKTLESKQALAEIWSSLMSIVGHQSGTRAITIEPINILCGPLRLSFHVYNTTHKNLTEILQKMVNNENFVITVILDESKIIYKAIRIYSYSGNDFESEIYLMGLNEVDIIVIICATTISVILVCAGLVICAREYYLKKRTRSFTLSSFMSKTSKSYDYTLTKMPRPNSTYSENGVRMKPMGGRDGQKTALLSIEEQETSVSDIQVRVNSNDDGIIVGVTGTGNNTHHSSDQSGDNGDQSEERLCPRNADTMQSVDNPIYYADDERFVNV